MLTKRLRLTKRGSFNYVYRKGKSLTSPDIRMVFVRSSSLKIGFSVSNKQGKAVKRNKLKRQMRAAVREYLPQIEGGYQIIFVLKRPYESYCALKSQLLELMCKAGLIQNNSIG